MSPSNIRKIALIDYGAGNVRSASRALAAAADAIDLEADILLTTKPEDILSATHIILPGVGHYAECMRGLLAQDGLKEALEDAVLNTQTPFLGICVGMQLLASLGLEDGETRGLNWIPGVVERIQPEDAALPVPHMGWNEIYIQDHPVFDGIGPSPHVYFTHSYAMTPEEPDHIIASCEYGGSIIAAVARDNIVGVQFHPEKSQKLGQKILSNFLNWSPEK